MYLTIIDRNPYLSFALAGLGRWLDVPLQNPRVVGRDLFVVALVHAEFFEALTLVEPFRFMIRYLDVEVDGGDPRLRVRHRGVNEMLEALRSDASRAVWLARAGVGVLA